MMHFNLKKPIKKEPRRKERARGTMRECKADTGEREKRRKIKRERERKQERERAF